MHKSIKAAIDKDLRLRPFAEDLPAQAAEPAADDVARRRGAAAGDPLAELERRYDGPIPAPLRAAALAGGAERLARRRARADLRVYRGLIRDTIACLRALRRAPGQPEPATREAALMAQLRWYRDRRREPLRRLGVHQPFTISGNTRRHAPGRLGWSDTERVMV